MTIKSDIYIALQSIKQTFEDRGKPVGAEIETNARFYVHVDCPGHAEYVKDMITVNHMTPALIVSAADAPPPLATIFNSQEKLMAMLDVAQETSFAHPMRIDLLPEPAPFVLDREIPALKKIKPHYRDHDYRRKHPILRR